MKVSEPQLTVGKSKQPAGYIRAEAPNLQAISQGLDTLGAGITRQANAMLQVEAEKKQKQEQLDRFKATSALVDYNTQVELEQNEFRKTLQPDDVSAAQKSVDIYIDREAQFIKSLPPDLQEEFKMRVADTRARVTTSAYDFQDKQLSTYYQNEIEKRAQLATGKLAEDPELLDTWRADIHTLIETSDLSTTQKVYLTQKMDEFIETGAYRAKVRQNRLADAQYADDLVTATRQAAQELGADPIDLLTVISFETGGTFSTGIRGGSGNRHIGLIQFGPEEQKQFGAAQGQSIGEQMAAVVRYLKARGYKPGMGILDLYSTINAGSPGRYNASDERNGGTPGTVADKVRTQMAEHRANALRMLDGKYVIPDEIDSDPRFANVPYEARMAARTDTNTEINQLMAQMREERKAQNDAYINNIKNETLAGNFGRVDYDREIAEGRLNDFSDRKQILEMIEKREKDEEEKNLFTQRLASGIVLDPTDNDNKKGMNLLFGKVGEQALSNRDQSYVNANILPAFEKYGMIAPDAAGLLAAMTRSNDARNVKFAVETLTALEEQNPRAYVGQINEEARRTADRWESLRGVIPEKDLMELLIGPPSSERRRMEGELRERAEKELSASNTKITYETLQNEFDAQLPGGWKGEAMQREWRQLVVENYAKTGGVSIEKANELAIKHLKEIWGVSRLDGRETIMRHPPDDPRFYQPVGGSYEWQTRQVRGEGVIDPDAQVILISDPQTENEISAGQLPSYAVYTLKDGVLLEHNLDGRPYRHRFEQTQEDAKLNETEVRLQNKEAELRYYQNLINTGEIWGGLVGPEAVKKMVPEDIRQKVEELTEELNAMKGVKEEQKIRAETQYETPAMKQLKQLEAVFKPINDELMNWVDPAEDFPKIKEWEKLYDEIEKLKAEAAKEAKAQRERLENR